MPICKTQQCPFRRNIQLRRILRYHNQNLLSGFDPHSLKGIVINRKHPMLNGPLSFVCRLFIAG